MQHLLVDPLTCDAHDLAPAVDWLRQGGVVAFPTDTFYGLAVDPCSEPAVSALFELKGRGSDAALPLIAASLSQVEAFVGPVDELTRRVVSRCWPGPLSLVFAAPPRVCATVHAGQGTLALRVPDHRVARALAEAFGGPVTSTSANPSGAAPARHVSDLDTALAARVFVIDGGPTAGGAPSTIVDARVTPARLIRAGAVPWERVLESLRA
jgi:L-threonylcarbamoyladenylate synthase